jgi:hypothetical protein
MRPTSFESEGREFESLRARQHFGLQIMGFLQFASFYSKNLVLRPIFLSPEQSMQHGRKTAVRFSIADLLAKFFSNSTASRVGFEKRCPEGMAERDQYPQATLGF